MMTKLLQLNSSLFSGGGESSRLADQFVKAWLAANPGTEVTVRDLSQDAVPHLDAVTFQAFLAEAGMRTPEQEAAVALSDALVEELRRADIIVLGLPMYNFGIPSTLKAYFDHIARAGITFRYTDAGPEGLLTGKRAIILATRGGQYAGTPLDSQTNYVRDFLRFVGITDVEFIYAEGLAMGDTTRELSRTEAEKHIAALCRCPLQTAL